MFTNQLHTIYVEWLKVKHPGSIAVSPWKFRDVYTKCYNILPRYVKSILVLVLNIIIMTKLIIMINPGPLKHIALVATAATGVP